MVKALPANARDIGNASIESRFHPWVGKIPCRRKWQPTPVLLPGKPCRKWSLVGYSPWGHKRVRHDLATENTHVYQEQWMKTKYIFLF